MRIDTMMREGGLGNLTLVLAVTLALNVFACSGKPDAQTCTGDFCFEDLPELQLNPPERDRGVAQGGMEPGEISLLPTGIANSGTGVLTVTNVTLNYTAPAGAEDGEEPAYVLVSPRSDQLPIDVHSLGGDQFPKGMEVQVKYTKPADGIARDAVLVLTTTAPEDTTVEIRFSTETGQPEISTDRGAIDFGLVPKETVGEEILYVLNTGTKTLAVSGFRITSDVRFGVKGLGFEVGGGPDNPLMVDLAQAIMISAGETHPVTVTFNSDSPAPAEGGLKIYSNDPVSGTDGFEVSLTANKTGPCILVDPRQISYGGKLIGTVSTIEVSITSCGTKELTVDYIGISADSSPDFGVDVSGLPGFSDGGPMVLPINETVTVPVTFVPDAVNPKDADGIPIPDKGVVVIQSDAFEDKVEVELIGAGAEVDCPVAVIEVEEGEEVIPQTVLHLDGINSYAPFGSVVKYSWSVDQPDGSQETFVPASADVAPVFAANVVGLYTFKLDVWDENNSKSCVPGTYSVIVQSDQAIHVELTWVTPGDTDETDTGEGVGSDMDLHFTHPSASGPDLDKDGEPDPWFDTDWDCFWYNQEPSWGSFDPAANDDPTLDRDDTDGAGPENLNLGVPEDDTTYRIAAHYWNDNGFGDVEATVRIFSYATEIFVREGVPMSERDLWCVGSVHWPTALVEPCSGEVDIEEIVGDYVNPFFFEP